MNEAEIDIHILKLLDDIHKSANRIQIMLEKEDS